MKICITSSPLEINGVNWTVSNEDFWHIAPINNNHHDAVKEKNPDELCMLLNNVYIKKGLAIPMSILLKDAGRDTLQKRKSKNEEIFEEVRCNGFLDKPCRFRCHYLFVSKNDAESKNALWFRNKRKIFRCKLVFEGTRVALGDANLISSIQDDWSEEKVRELALKYWKGEESSNPCPELLVDGTLFFPEWETFSEYDLRAQQKLYLNDQKCATIKS